MLRINQLTVQIKGNPVVSDVSLSVSQGEIVGIVGESGSGKSVTALAVMGLLPKSASIGNGSIRFESAGCSETELVGISAEEHRKLRGKQLAMIFQEPHTSLNPSMRCGKQIVEAVSLHTTLKGESARQRAIGLLREMQLPDPEKIYRSYPHQLSGGQKQRVIIAIALAGNPTLLIADEPTTALDVTVQREILTLIKEISRKHNIGVLFISHDLGVIETVSSRVVVMQKGRIAETGTTRRILRAPNEPYTRKLVAVRKKMLEPLNKPNRRSTTAVLSIKDLSVSYGTKSRKKVFRAVERVSFELFTGETLGLVGESGSGKSSIGRAILNLIEAQSGTVRFNGRAIDSLSRKALKQFRQEVQLVFQDPFSSLNPRLTIGEAIAEPIRYHRIAGGKKATALAIELLERVGLEGSLYNRYPHEFSGGQRQRIVLARALSVRPRVLICDEIISALDLAIQAKILDLLEELKKEFGLTYLFITHDLGVVRHICNRVLVLKQGRIVEQGDTGALFVAPSEEYTRKLIESIPGYHS